jgi:dihydrofolate reductase
VQVTIWAGVSVSLDGFMTGLDDRVGNPLGTGGERLHRWLFEPAAIPRPNRDLLDNAFSEVGAVVMGGRMFDLGLEPWGGTNPFNLPVFVVTHRENEPLVNGDDPPMTFVTDGFDSALAMARTTAGAKDVLIAGGASMYETALRTGVLDEIRIALIPVILGGGRPLFDPPVLAGQEFEPLRVNDQPDATHIEYRVIRP